MKSEQAPSPPTSSSNEINNVNRIIIPLEPSVELHSFLLAEDLFLHQHHKPLYTAVIKLREKERAVKSSLVRLVGCFYNCVQLAVKEFGRLGS